MSGPAVNLHMWHNKHKHNMNSYKMIPVPDT